MLWLKNLFTEMGFSVPLGLPMCIDNQSAMQVAKNPEHHGRMKHLDFKYYWLRDEVEKKVLAVDYIPTDSMVADILTKPLTKVKVLEACRQLGLQRAS